MVNLNIRIFWIHLLWFNLIWAQQDVQQQDQAPIENENEVKKVEPIFQTIYQDVAGNEIEKPLSPPIIQDALIQNDDLITRITAENFASFVNDNDLVLLQFTIAKCPHSKMILPELWQAAVNLKPHGIKVGQIDCDKDDYICSELKISYYPTFKIFKNKKMIHSNKVEYDRSANGLTNYMLTQIGNSIREISNDQQLKDILNENPDQFVVVENGIPALNQTFNSLANELFQSHIFVSYPKKLEIENDETSFNKTLPEFKEEILLYTPFNITNNEVRGEPLYFQGNFTEIFESSSKFNSWLKYAPLPNYSEVNIASFKSYIESKLPLGHFFYVNETEFNQTKPFFEGLGEKYKGQINFIALNARIYFKQVKYLNLLHQFPVFGILDIENNLKYGTKQMPMDEYLKLTEFPKLNITEVEELVESFANGTAVPNIKSEEIPEVQDTNVTRLVAHTHDDFINNNNKDVLVRYFADWDMHSKKTTEMFIELSDFFAATNDYNEKIALAEIDASANDLINVNVGSYPTFILYPAGFNTETDSGIVLIGPKTPKYIINLIRKNGTFDIDAREEYLQLHPEERENFYSDIDLTDLSKNSNADDVVVEDNVVTDENIEANLEEKRYEQVAENSFGETNQVEQEVVQEIITENDDQIVEKPKHDEL